MASGPRTGRLARARALSGSRAAAAGSLLALWIVAGWGCAERASTPPPEPTATRASMAEIVEALEVALPASLSEARFADPSRRQALEAALGALRDGATTLESHGRERDASFAHLSRSLALDAAEIERRFSAGRFEEARFLLGELVDTCVGCHSRLPAGGDSDLGRSLYERVNTEPFTAAERARLEVATRQFDRALETYEELFTSPDARALDLEGLLVDYLVIAIRVDRDLERARDTLEQVAARPEVPAPLRELVRGWSQAAGELAGRGPGADPVGEARALVAEGEALRRVPADRAGLIHDLVASAWLMAYVAQHPEDDPSTAEAYYLLGVTELHADHGAWLSEPESYLETAIRNAPGSPAARMAYAVLEEETLADYGGSSGVHLPPEVARWLDELRALAEGSPPAPGEETAPGEP